jgi:SAM-dependent methyltransferase
MRELEDQHWWFQGRSRIVATLMGQLGLPEHAKMLDLGCGTGGNLQMLSGFGSVTGVELDDTAADLARQRGHAPVLSGSLPDNLPVAEGDFDCVTLFDVLEHVPQDAESLATVNRLLRPGGSVFITVPAFMFLWGPHDEAHHHQRRYRAKQLRGLLTNAGFGIEKLSYYNTWLFPPAALVRLLRKIVPGGDAGLEVALPPKWLNGLLRGLFASERHVLSRANFPFGVSLLAVARKSGGTA